MYISVQQQVVITPTIDMEMSIEVQRLFEKHQLLIEAIIDSIVMDIFTECRT